MPERGGRRARAAEQLNTAAARIAAFARTHRRLHLFDQQDKVAIKQHLQDLCTDLACLLSIDQVTQTIVVESPQCELPATLAVPISLIVNELITNSVKYAKINFTVRFESKTPVSHSISVVDDGLGMPRGFDPAKSAGLGMQIVLALVKEIGGDLRFMTGMNGRGTMVTLTFFLPDLEKASSVRAGH
jgi:two-component sensor histidine kinase